MNVDCTACSAKYSLPDDKVRGKRARFTCKRCGAPILVDGSRLGSPGSSPSAAPSRAAERPVPARDAPGSDRTALVSEPPPAFARSQSDAPAQENQSVSGLSSARAQQTAGMDAPWMVATGEDRRESLSTARVVELLANGEIGDETYLWREGMSDWKRPREIPELDAAFAPVNSVSGPVRSSPIGSVPARAPRPPSARRTTGPLETTAHSEIPQQPRRRTKQSMLDELLSGSKAPAAAGEPASYEQAQDQVPGLTMDANRLEASAAPRNNWTRIAPDPESQGLLIQAASAPLPAPAPALASGVNDGFVNNLSAPDFTAPAPSEPAVAPLSITPTHHRSNAPFAVDIVTPAKKRGRAVLYAALLIAAAVAIAFGLRMPQKLFSRTEPSLAKEQPATEPVSPAAANRLAPAARTEPSEPPASATESEDPASALAPDQPSIQRIDLSELEASSGAKRRSASSGARVEKSSQSDESTRNSGDSTTAAEPPATQDAVDAPSSDTTTATAAPNASAPTPEAAEATQATEPAVDAAPPAPPFDRTAAAEAMRSAAESAQNCKTAAGPTGSGVATITFAPSGRVTSASVTGDFAGSTVGGCVAKLFRAARITPFTGDAVTVTKRFSVD